MAVNGVTGTGNGTYTTQTGGTSSLQQDEFLKILVQELKNQNPLDPADNTDFVVQMVQFQLLEQLQELSKAYESSQALGLLGKSVVAQLYDETTGAAQYIQGEVESVLMNDGHPLLQIGDYMVSVDDIVAATDVPEESGDSEAADAPEDET